MPNKYNDTEIIAAINVVRQILDSEEFNLDVVEVADGDWTTALMYQLKDLQGGNYGDIENEYFDNLASIIDRMDIYHEDYFYNPFEERQNVGEHIERNDWDRKILMFLKSDYCTEILQNISASVYSDYAATGFGLNEDKLSENKEKGIDDLDYLLYKDVAQKIIDSQSAYVMAEYKNKVYISAYDTFDNKEKLVSAIKKCELPDGDFENRYDLSIYDSYKQVVEHEYNQVREDMNDIGLLDDGGKWKFYLSQDEMIFMGIDEHSIENQLEYENEFIPKTKQAENLPKGWAWKMYDDGSGCLESPDGKTYFEYDLTTGEYKVTPDKSYDFFMVENYETGGYSIGGFDKFKEYAEDYINKNILNTKEKGENNMKYYSVSYEKNDISQAIIVKANNAIEAQNYISFYRNTNKVYGATELSKYLYEDYKRRGYPEVEVPDDFNKNNDENELYNNEEISEDEPELDM